jgi:hypothetical protein
MDAKDRQALVPHIVRVLENAVSGKPPRPRYITSYQILAGLPPAELATLVAKFGPGGAGANRFYTSASAIAEVMKHELAAAVDVEYLNTNGARFEIDGQLVEAGYDVVGLYRLRQTEDAG